MKLSATTDRPQPKFHDLHYKGDLWKCPITGFTVAKGLVANTLQRERIIEACEGEDQASLESRAYVLDICKRSFLVFCNLFLFTYRPIEHTEHGKRADFNPYLPFITWPVQDDAADVLIKSTGMGKDPSYEVCVDKSREMGASWLCLAIMVWFMLFYANTTSLCASRKEDLVEKTRSETEETSEVVRGDQDTLFWKIDVLLHFLPFWMKPQMHRTKMHVQNLDNASTIDGETTQGDLARGGRRLIIMLDEAAAIDELKDIESSVMDAGTTVWYVSTPLAGSWYSEIVASGKTRLITLGWWDHPDKGGQGRMWKFDPERSCMVVDGPFRQREKQKRRDPQNLAMNVDIDHTTAGKQFFTLHTLNQHAQLFARPPDAILRFKHRSASIQAMKVGLRKRDLSKVMVGASKDTTRQGWWYWGELERDPDGRMRPPQNHTYIFGIDISMGNGASNSVCSVYDVTTGQKIAEFATASMSPGRFCAECVMAGIWFGGTRGVPFLVFEGNGPGLKFSRVLKSMCWPWYYRDRVPGKVIAKDSDKMGWYSSKDKKLDLLFDLREAYADGSFVNPSELAIQETKSYIRFDNGEIGPKHFAQESVDALKTHGDRTIADALCVLGSLRYSQFDPPKKKYARGSPGEEIERLQRRPIGEHRSDDDEDEDGESDGLLDW